MAEDVVSKLGYLFLGSRMKRIAERLQGDVMRLVEEHELPIQPAQCPILVALDRNGPMTVGDMVQTLGVSQPGVTRTLNKLAELGFVESARRHQDRRHRTMALTATGRNVVARAQAQLWPQVEAAATALCAGLDGPLLEQLDTLERRLADRPLYDRVASGPMAGLSILRWSDDRAQDFHDINGQWIDAMFTMEDTDRAVLENPREKVIDRGGDILFVAAEGYGIVGTGALQKTGDGAYELTKMGVREAARGKKAGEFLLQALIRRGEQLGAEKLYLLTNSICASAIHFYQKHGFEHDADIMREHGSRYCRCDVAMRYRPDRLS